MAGLASTPDPPYTAVIFTSIRTEDDVDAYASMAARMEAVAEHQLAQKLGRTRWYRTYRVRVATVERDYGLPDAP
jgi:hypothetical protein